MIPNQYKKFMGEIYSGCYATIAVKKILFQCRKRQLK